RKQLGGGFIPILGAFSTTTKTAEIGLDVKVIDVARAKLVEAKTFQANNETSSTSFGAGVGGPGFIFGGAMQSIKGTPMEPILRDILTQVAS
ncbi:CsgG/HfaB family protein, partial [Klebsiella pneumoniae]